jgi:hypothetical protein
MFSGLLTTKTFWIGLVTVASGISTMATNGAFGHLDFSSIGAAIDTVRAVASTGGWQAVMLGIGIITGRHAIAKMQGQ